MYLRPILLGFIAALLAHFPRWVWAHHPDVLTHSQFYLIGAWVAAMGLVLYFLSRDYLSERAARYYGLSDLVVHIHHSPTQDLRQKWGLRAIISLLFSTFGGRVGFEGAALEAGQGFMQGTRSQSLAWFEQQRRTDVACVLAAALAATFGAPFAGVVLAMEYRVGGHTLAAVVSALVAFAVTLMLREWAPVEPLSIHLFVRDLNVNIFRNWRFVPVLFLVGAGVALTALGILWFWRLGARAFAVKTRTGEVWRMLVGGILFFAVLFLVPSVNDAPQISWIKWISGAVPPEAANIPQLVTLFFASILALTAFQLVFGTSGLFWPILQIGGLLGCLVAFEHTGPLKMLSIFTAAGALLGAVMGAPITAAILVAEWSRNPVVVIPVFICAWFAKRVLMAFKTPALIETGMKERGIELDYGRSRLVLEAIPVDKVMVTHGLTVQEGDGVSELKRIFEKSKYPFVTVVNKRGDYLGVLAANVVEDVSKDPSLGKLLEAKDLLFRQGKKSPLVYDDETLLATGGIFEETPVVAVCSRSKKPKGLLFAHHVRIAYDREVERRF